MEYLVERDFPQWDYEGKSILIIGAGPSTLDVDWEKIPVDFVWTCNDFYLNERLLRQQINLVTMGNLQDYSNANLLEYMDRNDTIVLLEENHMRNETLVKNKYFFDKYKERIFRGQVDKEYTGIVGPPSRLITLACNLKASNIYFVGVDGFDKNLKNKHAFTNEEGLRGEATHNSYDKYYDHITGFFKRIYNDFGSSVKFHNLGEASDAHNIPSFVSKELFPLDEKTLEVLGKSPRRESR